MRITRARFWRRTAATVVAAVVGAVLLPVAGTPVGAIPAGPERALLSSIPGLVAMAQAGVEDTRGEEASAAAGVVVDGAATGVTAPEGDAPMEPGANPSAAAASASPLPPPAPEPARAEAITIESEPSPTVAGPHPDAVEVVEMRTQTTRTYRNPDGSLTLQAHTEPIHAGVDGEWVPVDVDLHEGEDGVLENGPAAAGIEVAEEASADRLVTVEVSEGRSVSYRLEGAADVTGDVDGDTVRYAEVLPGVDMELISTPNGVKENLILESPSVPSEFRFPLELENLTAAIEPGSGVVLRQEWTGLVEGMIPPGFMVDSGPDDGARSYDVEYRLEEQGGETVLVVTPDRAWLEDPARVWPVTVDPSTIATSSVEDTWVHDQAPGNHSADTDLWAGPVFGLNSATYLKFNTAWLWQSYITAATFSAWTSWSAGGCTTYPVSVHAVTQTWSASTLTTFPGPAYETVHQATVSSNKGGGTSCPAGWTQFNVKDIVYRWAQGITTNNGLTIRVPAPAVNNANSVKKFSAGTGQELNVTYLPDGASYGPGSDWVPGHVVTNNQDGKFPVNVRNRGTTTWPANGTYRLGYRVYTPGGTTALSYGTLRTLMPEAVSPQELVSLQANVGHLPPGTYDIEWDMVKEGAFWFSTQGVTTVRSQVAINAYVPTIVSSTPASGAVVTSLSPQLSMVADDPDDHPTTGTQYFFRICPGPDSPPTFPGSGSGCVDSGWQSGSSWTPSALPYWNKTAYWWGFVRDHGSTAQYGFQSPSLLLLSPPQPSSARWGVGGPTANDGGVDLLTRNFVSSVTDAAVGSAGPPLAITRTYNSQAHARVGAFGAGWTSLLDVAITPETGGLTVLLTTADGRQQRWGRTSETGTGGAQVFRGPLGVGGTLTKNTTTGVYTWTAGDRWRYRFSSTGALMDLTDPSGRSLEIVRNGTGVITKVQSVWPGAPTGATRRALHITWSGSRVSAVTTDPVTPSGTDDLTWTYTYSSNQLTQVCDPRPTTTQGCTTYTYAPSINGLLTNAADDDGTYLSLGYITTGTPRVTQRVDGESNQWTYSQSTVTCPGGGAQCTYTTVTQPFDSTDHAPGTPTPSPVVFSFDAFDRLTERTDEYGNDARWEYDALGFLFREYDENGVSKEYQHDAQGLLLAAKTPRTGTVWASTRYKYDATVAPGDPRYGQPTHVFDPRVTNITVLGNATRFTYDAQGRILTRTTPNTGTSPSGRTVTTTYDAVTGLVTGQTDEAGRPTTYEHDPDTGDLIAITAPTGLVTEVTYDGLGRRITVSEHAPSDTTPRTTTFAYDAVGNVIRTQSPEVINVVTETTDARLVTREYDRSRRMVQESVGVAPAGGTGEPLAARTTTWSAHDGNGNPTVQTDAAGTGNAQSEITTWTWRGQPRTVDTAAGSRVRYRYTLTGRLHQTWAEDLNDPGTTTFLGSTTYDPAGRVATEVDATGATVDHLYWNDGLLRRSTLQNYSPDGGGSGTDIVLEELDYDLNGNLTESITRDGELVTTSTYTAANDLQTVEAEDRRTLIAYRADGLLDSVVVTDDTRSELTDYSYNALPEVALVEVDRPTGLGPVLETDFEYDEWGRVTATIDPGGRRTDTEYDRLGRPVRELSPTTTVEAAGATPVSVRPTTETGYDVFDTPTQVRTPDGEITTTTYDSLGRPSVITLPSVERPDGGSGGPATVTPTQTFTYDDATRTTTIEDLPTGGVSTEVVDHLGSIITATEPAGTTSFAWDGGGRLTGVTDPEGAVSTFTYDTVGNTRTETLVERYGVPDSYTTTYDYDNQLDLVSVTSHEGGTTTFDHNPFGELVSTTAPDAGLDPITTTIERDLMGRAVAVTDGTGRQRRSSFDATGRLFAEEDYYDSTLVREVAYDLAPTGEVDAVTQPGPNPGDGPVTTTFGHDGHGNVTSVTQPGGITTSYGYDVMGRRVRSTDGNGNATWLTYNAWGGLETVTDPATTAHPALADRQWVHSYEAPGRPVHTDAPGGVATSVTYDAAGRLLTESGTGGDGGTVSRSIDWDGAGRPVEVTGDTGATTFTWDDRGNLLTSAGVSGSASFTYDGDSRVTSRTDAAGTTEFAYWPGGQVQAVSGGLTGETTEHHYDEAGRRVWSTYGSTAQRAFEYDGLGNLIEEQTWTGGTTYSSQTWEWGPDGEHLASTTIGPGPHAGAGIESYTYDAAGRLIETQGPSGTVATGWDNAGNRTSHGAQTAAYDQRNRLLTATDPSGTTTNTWTARGTLAVSTPPTGPATDYAFDSFDRLIEETTGTATTTYAWDGLDRLATVNSQAHHYAGTERDPVAATGELYERGTDGEILGFQDPSADPRQVRANHRGDLTTAFTPGATGATSSRSYTPFGEPTTVGTEQPGPGFQGDWTSASGIVHMDARWYDPATGTFLSRDDIHLGPGGAADTNRYTYAAANPTTTIDPTGHVPCAQLVSTRPGGCSGSGLKGRWPSRPKPKPSRLHSLYGGTSKPQKITHAQASSHHAQPARRPSVGWQPVSRRGSSGTVSHRPSRPLVAPPAPWTPPWWSSPTPTHPAPPGHVAPPSDGSRPGSVLITNTVWIAAAGPVAASTLYNPNEAPPVQFASSGGISSWGDGDSVTEEELEDYQGEVEEYQRQQQLTPDEIRDLLGCLSQFGGLGAIGCAGAYGIGGQGPALPCPYHPRSTGHRNCSPVTDEFVGPQLRITSEDIRASVQAAKRRVRIQRNREYGIAAEERIASRYADPKRQFSRTTPTGKRYVDIFVPETGTAIESKVGRTALTPFVRQQIEKDKALLEDPNSPVDEVIWEFSTSPVTGRVGPTGPLRQALEEAGIQVVEIESDIHGP